MTKNKIDRKPRHGEISRRGFLKGAGAVAVVAGMAGIGVLGYETQEHAHRYDNFEDYYGEEDNRHSVTRQYLERLTKGEEVEAVSGLSILVSISKGDEKHTLRVDNPIKMSAVIDGYKQVVGYLGVTRQGDLYPQGHIAIFTYEGTKLVAEDDGDLRLLTDPFVDAYIPRQEGELPRGFELVYSGIGEEARLDVDINDSKWGGFTPQVVSGVTDSLDIERVSHTRRVGGGSDTILGLPDGIAVVSYT